MAETATVEQENSTGAIENQEERTFTQSELDEILKTRLAKERAKYSDYDALKGKASKYDEMEEANKTELQRATERADLLQKQLDDITKINEVRDIRERVAKDTGVPSKLLMGETEEDCIEQANAILAYTNELQSNKYPSVKDGGEVQNIQHKSVSSQFEDWFNASLN